MKISPINEMMPAYRDIKPVDNREIEIKIEKAGAGAEPKLQESAGEKPSVKPEINDGRETIGVSRDGDQARASREAME
ncbi:MAG: hypothetical protein K6A71_06290, partial [Lachnospiraceae bacterium]|nr:hypothetical protein [Lachnospiraceae bacterium]